MEFAMLLIMYWGFEKVTIYGWREILWVNCVLNLWFVLVCVRFLEIIYLWMKRRSSKCLSIEYWNKSNSSNVTCHFTSTFSVIVNLSKTKTLKPCFQETLLTSSQSFIKSEHRARQWSFFPRIKIELEISTSNQRTQFELAYQNW